MRKVLQVLYLVTIFTLFCFYSSFATAAKSKATQINVSESSQSESRASSSASYRAPGRRNLMADVSIHYIRDAKPDGATDTAARFSIGGMFESFVGLDLQGLYQARYKSYLVGADVRIVPVEWLFIKGGVGGYSKKQTNEFSLTPLAGLGIQAGIYEQIYLVTEASYFQIDSRENLSFGVGLGMYF